MDRDFNRTPWEPLPVDENPRPKRSWKRAILLLGLLFVVLPLLTLTGYYLTISNTVGSITFGGAGVDCKLDQQTEVFGQGQVIYGAVFLERTVTPGETLTMRLMHGSDVVSEVEFDIVESGRCTTQLVSLGLLAPGQYRVIFVVGDEQLADGSFEVAVSATPAT